MIKLIVFLGNYGKKYENTRHNAAWVISDFVEISFDAVWQNKCKGLYTKVNSSFTNNKNVHLLKPETFMNLSGESVGSAAAFFGIEPENILIVHDELELQPGVLSFKWSGGLGGHNGLRSVKAVLGTADFFRLRIGIGRPNSQCKKKEVNPDIANYVLSRFSKEELEHLKNIVPVCNTFFKILLQTENPQSLIKEWAKVIPS